MKIKGVYSRYVVLKKFNKRNIVLIKGKNRYISFDRDLQLLKYINFKFECSKCNLNYLDKYKINYVVLDNLSVYEDKKYNRNNYMKYLKLSYLYKIFEVITSNQLLQGKFIKSPNANGSNANNAWNVSGDGNANNNNAANSNAVAPFQSSL